MKQCYIFLFLILLPQIYSIGMASTFLPDNTLKILPNESFIYEINLQNGDDVNLSAEFILRSEIATIIDPTEFYDLKAKSYENKIKLNITLPKNVTPGTIYQVSYSLKPLSNGNSDIALNFRLNKNFIVEVIDPNPTTKNETSINEEKPQRFEFIKNANLQIISIVILSLLLIILY